MRYHKKVSKHWFGRKDTQSGTLFKKELCSYTWHSWEQWQKHWRTSSWDFFWDNVEIKVSVGDISRSHRIGKPHNQYQKTRPVIVKFMSYNIRNVFLKEKNLKGKPLAKTESLNKITKKEKSMVSIIFGQRTLCTK